MRPVQAYAEDCADGPDVFPKSGTFLRTPRVPPRRLVSEARGAGVQRPSERGTVRGRHKPLAALQAPRRHPGHALGGAQQHSSEQLASQRRRGRSLQTYIVPNRRLLCPRRHIRHRRSPCRHWWQWPARDVSCAGRWRERAQLRFLLLRKRRGLDGVLVEHGPRRRLDLRGRLPCGVLRFLVEGDGNDGLLGAAGRVGWGRLLGRRGGTDGRGRSGGHGPVTVVVRE